MLVKATLQQELVSVLTEMHNDTGDEQAAIQKAAEKLATAIDNYLKTAQVITTVNSVVTATCAVGPASGTAIGQVQCGLT